MSDGLAVIDRSDDVNSVTVIVKFITIYFYLRWIN